MDLQVCVCVCVLLQMQTEGKETLGRKEAGVDWASMQGAEGMKTNCCCDVQIKVCMCERQFSSCCVPEMQPQVIWHLFHFGHKGPEDTHTQTHPSVVLYQPCWWHIRLFVCDQQPEVTWRILQQLWGEHTEEHLCVHMGGGVRFTYINACVHPPVSLVRAKQVSSDTTLSSLWNCANHKKTAA